MTDAVSKCTTSAVEHRATDRVDAASGPAPPSPVPVDGVVLAGGFGRRMGGIDKGLALCGGRPLVAHLIERLQPQVRRLAVNANRHLDHYRRLGLPVWPDEPPGGRGPLEGMATALARCGGDWLACVPCDTPLLPTDLVQRLVAAAAADGTCAALAVTAMADGSRRPHPVVCLLHASLADDLRQQLDSGARRVGAWLQRHRPAEAVYDDDTAFANANTPDDLQRLAAGLTERHGAHHAV